MHVNQWMRRGLIMLIRSQSLLTLCNPSLSSVLHIIYSTVKKKKKGPQWQTGYLAEQKETCCRHPSIHVAGPSNPPDNPWLCWVFFFYDRHADRGWPSVENRCSSADKGQVFEPICRTNGQSQQWPFPSGASTRTVHCLLQGACLQSDITVSRLILQEKS